MHLEINMSKYDRPYSKEWTEAEIELIVRMGEEDRTILECFSRLEKNYGDVKAKVKEVLGRELRSERGSGSSL